MTRRASNPHAFRVLLVAMPFAGVGTPALGLSLLKSALARDGISCDVAYLNLKFARQIGALNYGRVANHEPAALLGEWIFAGALFADSIPGPDEYYLNVLRPTLRADGDCAFDASMPGAQVLERLAELRAGAARFLDSCLAGCDWGRYRAVGFAASFQQSTAALALARRLKSAYPHLFIALGGTACEGEMGLAIHRLFPCVDAVCLGEGDIAFPALVGALASGECPRAIDGIIFRMNGETLVPARMTSPVREMDSLPVPDYSDYFEQRAVAFDPGAPAALPIETSRRFAGVNYHSGISGTDGAAMRSREKSAGRLLDECAELFDRCGIGNFAVVDNIIERDYFASVAPILVRNGLKIELACEISSDPEREQVRALRESGITRIRANIGSLTTNLRRTDPCTYRGIRLLRMCAECLVEPSWNLWTGFPGEDPEESARRAAIVPFLTHLSPPGRVACVRLDRSGLSAARDEPPRFSAMRPAIAYRYVYPFGKSDLSDIAYYFESEHPEALDPERDLDELGGAVARWKSGEDLGRLVSLDDGVVLSIRDGRRVAQNHEYSLTGWRRFVYRACGDGLELAEALTVLADARCGEVAQSELEEFLGEMADARLMLLIDGRYLSLAIAGDYPLSLLAQHLATQANAPDDLRRPVARLFELYRDSFAERVARELERAERGALQ